MDLEYQQVNSKYDDQIKQLTQKLTETQSDITELEHNKPLISVEIVEAQIKKVKTKLQHEYAELQRSLNEDKTLKLQLYEQEIKKCFVPQLPTETIHNIEQLS